MNFDDLEKYVVELNKKKNDNCCLVCHLGNEKECIKLKCNHYFHKECLKTLKNCPYCNKKIILPIIEVNLCKSILKSGKRKGEVCGRKNCGYHK